MCGHYPRGDPQVFTPGSLKSRSRRKDGLYFSLPDLSLLFSFQGLKPLASRRSRGNYPPRRTKRPPLGGLRSALPRLWGGYPVCPFSVVKRSPVINSGSISPGGPLSTASDRLPSHFSSRLPGSQIPRLPAGCALPMVEFSILIDAVRRRLPDVGAGYCSVPAREVKLVRRGKRHARSGACRPA